ncbi:MAG: hypothetical protein QXL67_05420 [Candidatus Bathyarchaeia archaeon]
MSLKRSPNKRRVNYPSGDYHTLFFGEILSYYGDADAEEELPV